MVHGLTKVNFFVERPGQGLKDYLRIPIHHVTEIDPGGHPVWQHGAVDSEVIKHLKQDYMNAEDVLEYLSVDNHVDIFIKEADHPLGKSVGYFRWGDGKELEILGLPNIDPSEEHLKTCSVRKEDLLKFGVDKNDRMS